MTAPGPQRRHSVDEIEKFTDYKKSALILRKNPY